MPATPRHWGDCGFWIKTPQAPSFSLQQQMDRKMKGQMDVWWNEREENYMKERRSSIRETNSVPSSTFLSLCFWINGPSLNSPDQPGLLGSFMDDGISWVSWFTSGCHKKKMGWLKPQTKMKGRNQQRTDKNKRNCANFKRFALASCFVGKMWCWKVKSGRRGCQWVIQWFMK